MRELEIDLIQATLRPGDTLAGVVRTTGAGEPLVQLTLQGDEELGASSLAYSYVYPFFERALTLDCSAGPADFQINLPDDLPASYVSHDLRCRYVLKARRRGGAPGLLPGLRRDAIARMAIPVMSVLHPGEDDLGEQHWCQLRSGGVELEVRLDAVVVETGARLTGELLLTRKSEGAVPRSLSFRLAAIEESTNGSFPHRKVTSLQTHEVHPEEELPLRGLFEFPIDVDAPHSGEWNNFSVRYGFRVGMKFPDGTEARESFNILVTRQPHPMLDAPALGLTKDSSV